MDEFLTSGVLVLLGFGIVFNIKALRCKKMVLTDLLSAVVVLLMIPIATSTVFIGEKLFYQGLIIVLSIGNLIPVMQEKRYDYKKRLLQRILHLIFFAFSILIIISTKDVNEWYICAIVTVILYLVFMGKSKKEDVDEIHKKFNIGN